MLQHVKTVIKNYCINRIQPIDYFSSISLIALEACVIVLTARLLKRLLGARDESELGRGLKLARGLCVALPSLT